MAKKSAKKKSAKRSAKKSKIAGTKKTAKSTGPKKKTNPLASVGAKSRIIEHGEPSPAASEFPPAELPNKVMDAVQKHVSKHVGKNSHVLHEIMSMGIHLDVLPVEPTRRNPFKTFVTMGMSAIPMTVPKGFDTPKRIELCVVLPPDWKTDRKSLDKPGGQWFWPIQGLKQLGRLPSSFGSFLDVGHTVPNGDPPEPFGIKCPFVCWMVIPPFCFGKGFEILKGKPHSTRFLQIIPLYMDEMEYKLEHGVAALWDLFSEAKFDPIAMCDPKRPSACRLAKKRRSGT